MPALNAYKQNKSYTGACKLYLRLGKECMKYDLDFQDAEFLDTCV